MGSVVDRLKGRKATHTVDDLRPVDETDAQLPHSSSLEANRKDESNADEVTKEAQMGVQKAEAAALMWSKKAVYMIYAW